MKIERTAERPSHERAGLLVVVALAVLLTPAGSGTAAAEFSRETIACRAAIAKNATKLAKKVAKTLAACHKQRDRNPSMVSVDCNDVAAADLRSMVPAAEQRFAAALSSPTGRCGGLAPSDALYSYCPAPCDAQVADIATFGDVADCLVCLTRARIEALSRTIHGTPATPLSRSDRRCETAIGSGGARIFSLVARDVTRCQAVEEAAGATTVEFCTDATFPSRKVEDLTFDAENMVVSACGLSSFADLDSCADSQFALAECVGQDSLDAAQGYVREVLELPTTTTTSTTTTTTLPPIVTDPQCPDIGELVLYSRDTNTSCSTNDDCDLPRTCDPTSGICVSRSRLDSGWTGLSHNSDLNDEVVTRSRLLCPGPAPTCGECFLGGVDPSPGNCRCANNTRQICDQPFVTDAVNCTNCALAPTLACSADADCQGYDAGTCKSGFCSRVQNYTCTSNADCQSVDAGPCAARTCDCYFGAPIPLSSAGTPACIVNRYSKDISGTADVDAGSSEISVQLATKVYLGISTVEPCPFCAGECSDDSSKPCVFDTDCGAGNTCVQDVPNDGIRDGLCFDGDNSGLPCDVEGTNASFPAHGGGLVGGGGYSLDCMPSLGKNISGAGLALDILQSTGTQTLEANLPCDGGNCFCKTCSASPSRPCNADSDCSGGSCAASANFACDANSDCSSLDLGTCTGIKRCSLATSITCTTNADCKNHDGGPCNPSTCSAIGGSGTAPAPNACDGGGCSDVGNDEGRCTTGPDDKTCDGFVRANGRGILSCSSNVDCTSVDPLAGNCTLVERRACFLDPIVATGAADTEFPVGAAAFCVPPTSSPSINSVAGLPGPTRSVNQGRSRAFCASDPQVEYQPGVGGCP